MGFDPLRALAELDNLLFHKLDEFQDMEVAVAPDGPGRLYYESGLAELKLAKAAIAFLQTFIEQRTTKEVYEVGILLEGAVNKWMYAYELWESSEEKE